MEQKLLHILQNCRNFNELKQTHLQIFIHGLQQSNFILPKLINFSSTTFNSLDYAIQIFDYSHSPNVFVYNTMIECFIQKSRRKEAFFTYNSMMMTTTTTTTTKPSSSSSSLPSSIIISPNNFTLTILLKSCQELQDGRQLQTHIVKLGFGSNVFVQNTLLGFYSKCDNQNVDSARQVFEEMLERDIVSWNSIIGAYMARGETDSAIRLFDLMPERNVVSWNTIITGLSRSGDMETALSVFKQMPIRRNEVSWNAMITGYVRRDDVRNARLLFDQMPEKTVVSWTAMLSGYAKVRDLETMSTFFDSMPVKNVISWNAMIAGYVQNHKFDQGLSLFHQMLVNGEFRPNETTLLSVLSACTHLGALEQGKWIDSYIKKQKMDLSTSLGNALIDMFAKCGDVENAKLVFNQMTKRCIITWTTMVSGLAINGKCREALDLFDTLCRERVEPDDVIFIAVLSACTHGGLVEDGKRVFDCMLKQFGIKPRIEHYGCMVDLLGRAGMVEEAFRFITSMPMQANAVIWATLLGSCKVYGKGELLEVVTRKILDLEPSNPAYLMLISNLNASVGRWEDVLSVRAAMRKEGIEKVPGCSSIQVGNKVHEFLVKDTIHEQRKEVYEILHVLNDHLIAVDDVHLQVQLEY